MPFIPTPGCVRTDIQFASAGQQVHNIIWCSRDNAWTQAEREALNAAVAAWWTNPGKVNMSSAIALTQVTSVNQDAFNSPASTLVVTPPVTGTQAPPAVPNNAALCCTLRTDLRGRSFRGRFYMAGKPASNYSDPITWSVGAISDALSILGALKTVITGLGAIWVVVSHYTNKIARANGLKTPITAISADQYIDSQRRRLGLRGV